jgi:hypothetical protein
MRREESKHFNDKDNAADAYQKDLTLTTNIKTLKGGH